VRYDIDDVAERVLAGGPLTRGEALAVLSPSETDLLSLVAAGGRLRRAAFGDAVKLNYLVNLKSGLCPEDCGYCSQRLGSGAEILKYSWLGTDETAAQATTGVRAGAARVCLVASGRGPSRRDVERVAEMVGRVKADHPDVEVCVCLGILRDGQAERLRDAGADAYNHNLNTAESRHPEICTTHTFGDRTRTVGHAQHAGLSPCSGVIIGMGETDDELVDAIFALRDLDVDSIPVNFLMPFDGTPLAGHRELTPERCIRALALARFACPTAEVRMGAGREMHLRGLQPLGLWLANSLFLGDYLTSEGQPGAADLDMIADAGFEVLGVEGAGGGGSPLTIRRRGAGTEEPANA
jgi:biotin synthase